MHFAGAVRREHNDRADPGPHSPELRHADLEVAENLKQERLERLVGAVQLIDQQDGRRQVRVDRREQRPRPAEKPWYRCRATVHHGRSARLPRPGGSPSAGGRDPGSCAAAEVHPVVALQPHQPPISARRPGLWRFRSCRCRARPRGTRAAASPERGAPWSPAPDRGCSRRRSATPQCRRQLRAVRPRPCSATRACFPA